MVTASLILTNHNFDTPKTVVFLCSDEECDEFKEALQEAELGSDELFFDDFSAQMFYGSDVYYAAATLEAHYIMSDTLRTGRYSEFSRTLMALLDSPSAGVAALEGLF